MVEYIKGITHCTFLCRDYDAMVRFYRDILGLKQIFVTPIRKKPLEGMKKMFPELQMEVGDEWMTYLEISPHNFIELFRVPYREDNDTTLTGFHHICIEVEDIVEAARELEAKGVQLWHGAVWKNNPYKEAFPSDPKDFEYNPFHMVTFNIVDPEGNNIELMQRC